MSIRFEFCHHTTHPKGGSVVAHRHSCHELVYYITGAGRSEIDGIGYKFQAGQLALITPHALHSERHDEETEVLFIGFRIEEEPWLLPSNGLLEDEVDQPLLRLLHSVEEEIKLERTLRADVVHHLVALTALYTHRKLSDRMDTVNHKGRLMMARLYVDEHYFLPIRLDEVAKAHGYSYDRFRHLFKEEVGLSPSQYVQFKRIENAAMLLRYTELPIKEIALQSGFPSDSKLCERFKKVTGQSPLAYRKKGSDALIDYFRNSMFTD